MELAEKNPHPRDKCISLRRGLIFIQLMVTVISCL